MTDLSRALTAPGGFVDWVYDGLRDQIHFVTTSGFLNTWSFATQTFAQPYQVYGAPGSLDISADGAFLLIGNTAQVETSGPFAFEKTYVDVLTRVDLTNRTHQFQTFTPDRYGEGAIGDVAVGADGKGYLTTFYNGSGWTPMRSFTPASGAVSKLSVGRINELPASSRESSYLIPSEDRRYLFVQEANISDGAMHVYDTLTGRTLGSNNLYNIGSSGYQAGLGDISSAAGLVVDVLYGAVYVFDLALKPVANLSIYSQGGSISGGEFNDGGRQLFLWQGQNKKVLVLDVATWAQVGTIDVGSGGGAMDVASGGRFLLMETGGGLEVVDLYARLKINLTDDATSRALYGSIGQDTVGGGGGDDTVRGYDGQDYLRGDDGSDSLSGGADFDDLNGNVGDDTASGGLGDDWVVGGRDNDLLFGDAGADLVYGNLGSDTCDGGDGNDIVRGGQDDDALNGGAGADYLSGDKGADTVSGGSGADIFHTFGEAGVDRVTDFNAAEGDRVQLDPGTQHTVAQVGADTVISMTGGGQMILVGVEMNTLAPGWIFGA